MEGRNKYGLTVPVHNQVAQENLVPTWAFSAENSAL